MPVSAKMFSLALAVATVSGCGGNPIHPEQQPLGRSFDLRSGATAGVEGGLSVRFDRVVSDSRCAIDAICIWEGDAVLSVTLSTSNAAQRDAEIHTQPAQSEVVYGQHRVSLSALAPYPRSGLPTRPEDYVATFIVTPR
jgi:hypothetical protein